MEAQRVLKRCRDIPIAASHMSENSYSFYSVFMNLQRFFHTSRACKSALE
jgi:hypothetical protein